QGERREEVPENAASHGVPRGAGRAVHGSTAGSSGGSDRRVIRSGVSSRKSVGPTHRVSMAGHEPGGGSGRVISQMPATDAASPAASPAHRQGDRRRWGRRHIASKGGGCLGSCLG